MKAMGRPLAGSVVSEARVRGSWQPTQPENSPGITEVKLCIRFTASSFSSRATKKKDRCAGSTKRADPSFSTGTVPTMRSRVKVPP